MTSSDLNDLLMTGSLAEDLFQGAKEYCVTPSAPRSYEGPSGAQAVRDAFLTPSELRAIGAADQPWLVEPLITKGGLTYVYGDPKAGKTTFLTALLLAMAEGEDPVGTFELAERRSHRVLVFSEQPDGSNVHLIATLCSPQSDVLTSGRFRILRRQHSADLETQVEVLDLARRASDELEADVIVFDTFLDWTRGLEGQSLNEGSATSQAARLFRDLATDTGAAVVVVHHSRKAGGDVGVSMLGSQAIRASSDVNAQLTRPNENSTRIVLSVEGRDPRRLIEAAKGSAGQYRTKWAFELALRSGRDRDGHEQEWVDYVPTQLTTSDDDEGSPAHDRMHQADVRLARMAMRSLTDAAWQESPWQSSAEPPPFAKARLAEEMVRIARLDPAMDSSDYETPGSRRMKRVCREMTACDSWAKRGNRGFYDATWERPTESIQDLPGLSGSGGRDD